MNLNQGGRGVTLLIMIVSAPPNIKARRAIRQTWLTTQQREIQGRFVIGVGGLSPSNKQELEKELRDNGDLILLDIEDTYERLTFKVLKMIEHAYNHSPGSRFLMKCDDDTFVNTPLLAQEIVESAYSQPRVYWGFFDGRAPVQKKGKWSEVSYQICDRYVPYALGGGYIISWKVVEFLARSADDLKLFKNEDVSLGAWLAGIQVERIHDERFDTEWKSRGCANNMLVRQNTSPEEMRMFWDRLLAGKELCRREFVTRHSYAYNWTVPPSQCCKRRA